MISEITLIIGIYLAMFLTVGIGIGIDRICDKIGVWYY